MASGYILTEAEKEERIRYAASHNVKEFADMFGLAVGTAKVFYCRHGISARYKLEQRWNSIDKEKFCKYAASHTLNQIACHFHVSSDMARTLCKKFEIEPKSKLLLKDISTEVSRNHRNTATAHTMIKYLAGKFSYGSIGKVFGYSKERVRQICEADGKGENYDCTIDAYIAGVKENSSEWHYPERDDFPQDGESVIAYVKKSDYNMLIEVYRQDNSWQVKNGMLGIGFTVVAWMKVELPEVNFCK